MTKFAYTVALANIDELVTELNNFGAEGWEAIQCTWREGKLKWEIVFKKALP